ncbi:MAG: sugar ABC transporter permease [Candidatus Omnitrophica bacterium]|nr:sugar ABC transporter permease [bacterium]MBV6481325.1 Lactose transport system permease protein LacF [bacterium]MCE7909517.1 sugar ABC transporter permease [Candidatus Omnitrophica bacterium COP1]MCK6497372.1 sugar ABC transporter permease [bacterium]MCL4733415.1 sugar ABC transporter permease [Candidatus Omnitrophota bacterium]
MKLNDQHRERIAACLFLAPNLAGFFLFTLFPVIGSFVLAFTDWNIFTPPKFIGLAHFKTMFLTPDFWKYFWNTLVLMSGIPVSIACSLALALLMKDKLPGIALFRTLYFLPTVSSGVALFILWRWIYNPDFGLMNQFLGALWEAGAWFVGLFGFDPGPFPAPLWLSSERWAKPALILMGIWLSAGGPNMVLYLAGLQQIPKELIEAAGIDGAGHWTTFRHITWPMLAPTTFFIAVMSIIGGLQGGFEQVYIMTAGGPGGATTTLSFYVYDKGFEWFEMGYASAVAWFLFFMVFIATLFQWKFGRGAETYMG